jgi:hypothetical protein
MFFGLLGRRDRIDKYGYPVPGLQQLTLAYNRARYHFLGILPDDETIEHLTVLMATKVRPLEQRDL